MKKSKGIIPNSIPSIKKVYAKQKSSPKESSFPTRVSALVVINNNLLPRTSFSNALNPETQFLQFAYIDDIPPVENIHGFPHHASNMFPINPSASSNGLLRRCPISRTTVDSWFT